MKCSGRREFCVRDGRWEIGDKGQSPAEVVDECLSLLFEVLTQPHQFAVGRCSSAPLAALQTLHSYSTNSIPTSDLATMHSPGVISVRLRAYTAELEVLSVVNTHWARVVNVVGLLLVNVVGLAALENGELPHILGAARGKFHLVAVVGERLGISAPGSRLGFGLAEIADCFVLRDGAD
jgi:hypothetical protein